MVKILSFTSIVICWCTTESALTSIFESEDFINSISKPPKTSILLKGSNDVSSVNFGPRS